jgi:hypothetical protein
MSYDFELDEEETSSPPRAPASGAAGAYDFEIDDESMSNSSSPASASSFRGSSFPLGAAARSPSGAAARLASPRASLLASSSPSSAAARRAADILARPAVARGGSDGDFDASSSSDDVGARRETAALHRAAFLPTRGGAAAPPPLASYEKTAAKTVREENADAAEISEEEADAPAPVGGGRAHWDGVASTPAERRGAAPGSAIGPASAARALRAGARVWALYRSGAEWAEGVVSGSNGDGTWGVAYDDGDDEEAVPLARLRRHAGADDDDGASDYSAEFEEWQPSAPGGDAPSPRTPAPTLHPLAGSPPPHAQMGPVAAARAPPAVPHESLESAAPAVAPAVAPTAAPAVLSVFPASAVEGAASSSTPSSISVGGAAAAPTPPTQRLPPPAAAAQPAPAAPQPPPSFQSGLGSLSLLLAAHAPFLSIGSNSLASVLAAGGSGARPGGASPPPPPPQNSSRRRGPLPASAPSTAFLRALADGLSAPAEDAARAPPARDGAPPPMPAGGAVASAAVHSRLHPAVVASLAAAQASLVSVELVYARQLAAIRAGAVRSRQKLDASIARAAPPPGGSPAAPSGAAAERVLEKGSTSVGFATRARLAAPSRPPGPPPLTFAQALERVRLDGYSY